MDFPSNREAAWGKASHNALTTLVLDGSIRRHADGTVMAKIRLYERGPSCHGRRALPRGRSGRRCVYLGCSKVTRPPQIPSYPNGAAATLMLK